MSPKTPKRESVLRRAEFRNAVLVNLQGALGGFCGPLMLGALVAPILVRLGGSDLLIGMLSTLNFAVSVPGMILAARVGILRRGGCGSGLRPAPGTGHGPAKGVENLTSPSEI